MSNILEAEAVLKNKYDIGEPIFLNAVNLPGYSYNMLCKLFSKLKQLGRIEKYAPGIYYFTRPSILTGKPVRIRKESLIVRKYIQDGDKLFGFWGGPNLENLLGISPQIPFVFTIVTNKAIKYQLERSVEAYGQKVIIKRPAVSVPINNANINLQRAAELFRMSSYVNYEIYEQNNLRKFLARYNISYNLLFEFVSKNPTSDTSVILENMQAATVFN